MGILFGFKADDITTAVVDTFTDPNSTVVITTPLTVDPISDAVNNVRFAVNGFAADGTFAGIDLRTRAFFTFKIPQASRITVFGHLTHHGISTVTGRRKSWLFDWAGFAGFQLSARMRVRVRGSNNQIVFTRNSPTRMLFSRTADGENGTRTFTDIVAAGILEEFLTVTPPDLVLPDDTIFVRMQYNITAFAVDGAEFVADFDATGSGLNVPMVIVNF
jgi:hypothetical protein